MITCPRCGQPSRAGTPVCPYCQTRLAIGASAPLTDDSPPEWLQRLQSAHAAQVQQPSMPGAMLGSGGFGAPAGFAPAAPSQSAQLPAQSLVNPQALPDWMREAGAMPRPASASGEAGGAGWGQPQPFQPQPFTAAGPRPQPSVPEPGSFSANQLFDASALPEWLRQAGAGQPFDTLATAHQPAPGPGARMAPPAPPTGSAFPPAAFPPARQAFQPAGAVPPPSAGNAFPSIEQAGAFGAAPAQQGGVSAQSLLDPNALPAWLGGNGARTTGGLGAQQHSGRIPAQSLLDESSLPQWMRNQPAAPPAPAAPTFAAPSPQAPAVPGGWGIAPPPQAGPPPAPITAATSWGPASAALGAPQLSAGDFIDEGALPDWLRAQGQAAGFMPPTPPAFAPPASPVPLDDRRAPMYIPPATTTERAPSPAPTSATFAASDLIDADSLPQWVHGQSEGGASFSSTEGWTSKGPSMPLALGSGSLDAAPAGYTDRQSAFQAAAGAAPIDERPSPEDSSWYSGRQAASMDERMDSRSDAANLGRGAPIPREELPSWLRTDAPAGRSAARRAPAWDEPAVPRYGDEREQLGAEYGADAGYEAAPAWGDGAYEQPYDQPYDQQLDGDYDNGYGGYDNGYGGYDGGYDGGYGAVDEYGQPLPGDWDEGYGDYDDYDGAREPRRGFWGRLFGRR